ncbi:Hypothetical Protein FCC1311_008882 [Hondaea fermentalgiana]|uniref:Uncharacterized protein n=1 Tax=Hondaea fermentalgiana TaxID=2315210 RepID=A0A2R5G0Y7_9STRA|nr:Hypothetical Protein FCC1311_008882 [Hondaea fermentalgiana]|eukprot:GBG24670.1 Hypothetical Protein FCC1311_008882 [Hondaea fermentalgiana]
MEMDADEAERFVKVPHVLAALALAVTVVAVLVYVEMQAQPCFVRTSKRYFARGVRSGSAAFSRRKSGAGEDSMMLVREAPSSDGDTGMEGSSLHGCGLTL